MENRFTAAFEPGDNWWIAYVEELPGANTEGETLEEAVALVLEANRELAEREITGKRVIKEELIVVS